MNSFIYLNYYLEGEAGADGRQQISEEDVH